jgi:superfamily I DNA/RNA helicase
MPQFKFNTISRTDIESSLGGAQMILAIDYDGPHHLLITGCPGSGKTTVSMMRAQRLVNMNSQILVITFQNLLKTSLLNIAENNLKTKIHTFLRWYKDKFVYLNPNDDETAMLNSMNGWNGVDEIIIDEGQDFESRVYRSLLKKCKRISVGADNAQRVHSSGLKVEEIKEEINRVGSVYPIHLLYNYRNTFEVYNFARYFLPFNERANNNLAIDRIPKGKGIKPSLFLVQNEEQRLNQLKILLTDSGDRNIAILVNQIAEVNMYHKVISDMGFKCSKYTSLSPIGNEIENIIVTTFISAKGLEFQVVIMPTMETKNGTDEQYYIACTRAKENLFLIAKGETIPSHFIDFDSASYQLTKVRATDTSTMTDVFSSLNNDDLPF